MGRLVFPFLLQQHHGPVPGLGPSGTSALPFRVMAMLQAQIGLQGFVDFLKLRISADGKKRQGEGLDATVQEGQVEFRP